MARETRQEVRGGPPPLEVRLELANRGGLERGLQLLPDHCLVSAVLLVNRTGKHQPERPRARESKHRRESLKEPPKLFRPGDGCKVEEHGAASGVDTDWKKGVRGVDDWSRPGIVAAGFLRAVGRHWRHYRREERRLLGLSGEPVEILAGKHRTRSSRSRSGQRAS